MFQSTPPRGGRLAEVVLASEKKGFNPRPRVGGDPEGMRALLAVVVSIHAPAWGATLLRQAAAVVV